MPEEKPGLRNDGRYTAAENIADLGGFLIAYDMYTQYLNNAGFFGEQFDLQRKRFYEAYGWLWHSKYSAAYAEARTNGINDEGAMKDEHSLPRERTNGIVANTDDWYKLFNIKESDKLYRKTEDRIRIW